MVTAILLPLDGSTISERALPYAGALARRFGSRIVLIEAVDVHPFLGVNLCEAQICGAGGVLAEVLRDVSVRLTWLSDDDISEMPRELRTYPLVVLVSPTQAGRAPD
jgi:hypothetical protein